MLRQEQIDQAFSALRKAMQEYWTIKIDLMKMTKHYDRTLGVGILENIIRGKNEMERLGSMWQEFPTVSENYFDLKEKEAQAKMELDLAKLEVDQIDMSLRFLYGEGS